MIIYQINVHGIDALEAPRDAPIGTHRDRPITAPRALQRVQSNARQIHIFRSARAIQHCKNVFYLIQRTCADVPGLTAFKQPL